MKYSPGIFSFNFCSDASLTGFPVKAICLSFLRLNNATLGYTLDPSKIGLADYVNNLRLTLTGQNLFVISDYSGFDPEVNTGNATDGIQTFGIDRFTYPSPRTLLLGLNVSF